MKREQHLQVKIGHGGTLDPMATGVLILGVGRGTKALSRFLECTKSYEAVVLFGAATDTYDSVGKVVGRKSYDHVTKKIVEEALNKFRGKIMQRPPIFSALRVQGKHLYEYAREGKKVPVEIEERPVEVQSLNMVEWMDGGTHEYHWPEEEAPKEEKKVVDKVLHLDAETGTKRKRDDDTENGELEPEEQPSPKRSKSSPDIAATDAIGDDAFGTDNSPNQPTNLSSKPKAPCPAPACRIRMTTTSGFYVRSFSHDLGAAVNSLGLMASLVRTRQGDFELGTNVLEYDDLAKGEEVWASQIGGMLTEWNDKEKEEGRGISEDEVVHKGWVGKRESKPRMRAKMRRANPDYKSVKQRKAEAEGETMGEEQSGKNVGST